MARERVVLYCPDENIRLSVDRLETLPTGGGKSAILRLGYSWAELGHQVIIACALATPGKKGRLAIADFPVESVPGDVAVFVTGSRGHFQGWWEAASHAAVKIFWINGPNRVTPPPTKLDWIVAPAQFLAQKAIVEWGFPAEKVVVIRGESADPCGGLARLQRRNPYQGIFLSHPAKGLDQALFLFEKMRVRFPQIRLHVLGSERLWGDQKMVEYRPLPQGALFLGEKPPLAVSRLLPGYGFLLYLSPVIDGFSSATAEAMAAGLIVFAAAHGSNAELISHGQNGFLIPLKQGLPDLEVAERLLGAYLQNPEAWNPLRAAASKQIPSWRSQAVLWRKLWRRCWSSPLATRDSRCR